jgi:hypothetical protein
LLKNPSIPFIVEEKSAVEVAKLIAEGADVNAHDTNGDTAFSEACCMGNMGAVKMLMSKNCLTG